ncbi:MAG TPA: hypothetical protein VLK23_01200 [Thermodesulfobacteriota bacterium]|nr:hypothetical protein [Thermodesulfobacteriota bacterium]
MARENCTDYFLRNVENALWRQVKARAALEGRDVRDVILEALRNYVAAGIDIEGGKKGKKKERG